MGDYSFTMECARCSTTLYQIENGNAQAWKNDANNNGGHVVQCSSCGAEYTTEDDGVAVGSGGGVQRKDISKPKVTSLDIVTGAIAGGTTIRVTGEGFQVSGQTPVVKFNGVEGTNLSVVSDTELDVDSPVGDIQLVVAEGPYGKLTHGSVTGGPFTVGETISGGTSSATATVKEVGDGFLLVWLQSDMFTDSETLTGGTSGATASYTSMSALPFEVGETVTGATSSSTGTVTSANPLRVSSPSGAFTSDEEVTGGTSGARAQLHATTPMNGDIDVTIENGLGQRTSGHVMVGGFEYTVS
jgi:hypothetical protein